MTRAMLWDVLTRLREVTGHLDVLLVQARTKGVSSNDLLDQSPGRLSDLPAWFATLAPEQFRTVWVSAVLSAMQEYEWSYSELAFVLRAVRDYPNCEIADLREIPADAPPLALAPPAPELPPRRRPKRQAGRPKDDLLRVIDTACPKPGMTAALVELFPKPWERQRALQVARDSGRYRVFYSLREGITAGRKSAHVERVEASDA